MATLTKLISINVVLLLIDIVILKKIRKEIQYTVC